MTVLLDTHYLLWAAYRSDRITGRARDLLMDPDTQPWFSVTSLWEVAIKRGLGRADFTVEPATLRAGLLANGYRELAVEGRHVLAVMQLDRHHADPFDRMLIAQARAEGMPFLTADQALAAYGSPVMLM